MEITENVTTSESGGYYCRISKDGYRDGDELAAQLRRYAERTERFAASKGLELPPVTSSSHIEETDVSGGLALDERGLGLLVEAAENGEIDYCLFPDVDRFGRNVRYGMEAYCRMTEAGCRLLFAYEEIDSNDPGAEEAVAVALAGGQKERKKKGKGMKESAEDAIRRGIHSGSIPPLGYRWPGTEIPLPNGKTRFKKNGPLELVPEEAARVVAGFEAFDRGGSWREITKVSGCRSHPSNMLSNRVYLGIAYSGDIECAEAHPAIIDPALFQRVQDRLAARVTAADRLSTPKRHHEVTELAGILRCHSCGTALRPKDKDVRACACPAHEGPKVRIRESAALAYILEIALRHHADTHEAVAMNTALDETAIPVLIEAVVEAERQLAEIKASNLSPLRKGEALDAQDKILESNRRELDNAQANRGWHGMDPATVAAKIDGDPAATNAFLRELVAVEVGPGGARDEDMTRRIRITPLLAGKTSAERTSGTLRDRASSEWAITPVVIEPPVE